MKSAFLLAAAGLLLEALHVAQPVPRRPEPFVPVGVSYRSELSRDRERATADLEAIQTLGFNSIRVPLEWADIEPARGRYQFDALDRTLELAGKAGLKVVLQINTASFPDWLLRRYPDGRFVPESRADGPRPERACLDHPGVRADVVAYVGAASARAAPYPAWHAIDFGSEPQDGLCVCPHTQRRLRDWLKTTHGSDTRSAALAASDRARFVALERRDRLALLAGASAARGVRLSSSLASAPSIVRHLIQPLEPPGQDDWLMAAVVNHYGTLVPPELIRSASLAPSQLALSLDGIRSAARDRGWLMTDRTVTGRAPEAPSAADLRLWTWAALSRGARGVTYADWRTPAGGTSLTGPDGTISDRARVAGALARVVGRNPALFAPLRPRAAKVAIVYDPRPSDDGSAPSAATASIYRALFERNLQVDFIHLDEIAAGAADRYRVVFAGSISTLPAPAAEALKAYVAAGGTLISSTPASTDQQILQIAVRAGVSPDVRLEGAIGPVETRFLESTDVLMLIGLNHAETPQRVRMTFTPDTQEAIWQNMETGAAVNFVAGPEGPSYTYSFGPRDALILMIRKNLR